MKGVALLGCTGSIGRSALNVLERHSGDFRVVALAANRRAAELGRQVERYHPDLAVLVDEEAFDLPKHGTVGRVVVSGHGLTVARRLNSDNALVFP